MVSSTLGFIYSGDSTTKKVNGHKFIRTETGWRTYVDGIESYWEFTYLPNEIGFDLSYFNFNSNRVYLYSTEGGDYLDKFKFILLYSGVTGEIVDEANCTSDIQTLVLTHSFSEPEITTDGNCININGNLNKVIDGFTYKTFGMI